ncbi:MAG: hypothetical protein DME41_03410 [Verrucomicrobia bacterium]|nr:MAG: hypothetical protein DME41_03410 [Verrucomicrobiota bacterium]
MNIMKFWPPRDKPKPCGLQQSASRFILGEISLLFDHSEIRRWKFPKKPYQNRNLSIRKKFA